MYEEHFFKEVSFGDLIHFAENFAENNPKNFAENFADGLLLLI